ncbi:hypothetical protein C1N51_27215 (plasmid) [Vibrio campbellii]|nr:hypothetical protein C1N51_27215 [Vibrio campbellii]
MYIKSEHIHNVVAKVKNVDSNCNLMVTNSGLLISGNENTMKIPYPFGSERIFGFCVPEPNKFFEELIRCASHDLDHYVQFNLITFEGVDVLEFKNLACPPSHEVKHHVRVNIDYSISKRMYSKVFSEAFQFELGSTKFDIDVFDTVFEDVFHRFSTFTDDQTFSSLYENAIRRV